MSDAGVAMNCHVRKRDICCFALLAVVLGGGEIRGEFRALPPVGVPTVARHHQVAQPPVQGEMLWFGEDRPPLLIPPGQAVVPGTQDCFPPEQQMPAVVQWGSAPRCPWHWQILPSGLVFPNYLAGRRESRLASVWYYQRDHGWLWDAALGARVGLLRYGDDDPVLPHGWQIDVEGAAFPRLDLESQRQLVSTEFRFGVPLSLRRGPFEGKLAYYHLSSHLGDEFLLANPGHVPLDFVRDAVVVGVGIRLVDDLRVYAEAGYAFYTSGGSEPLEFQFGVDYSRVAADSFSGSPFFAINGRFREEVDFGGNLTVQAGWQWRGDAGRLLRLGLEYFNGKTDAYQFFSEHEQNFGLGLWYDF